MSKNSIRPLGHITSDLEPLLCEMAEQHEMQAHEIMGIIYAYLQSHLPDSIEEYEAGGSPIFYYGPALVRAKQTKR